MNGRPFYGMLLTTSFQLVIMMSAGAVAVRRVQAHNMFTVGRYHGERGGKFYVAIMRTADNAYQMGRSL